MLSNKPDTIHWMYSGKCNLNCGFCYGKFNQDKLSLKQKYSIVDIIGETGIQRMTLTGGEPLLGEDIYDIIRYAGSKGIQTSLHTNGILLDKEGIEKIKPYGHVSLAIEGSTNEINEEMRGYKNYLDLNINLMQVLKEKYIKFSVKTVATKKNIDDIPNMINLLVAFRPYVWFVSEFRAQGRGKKKREDYEIDRKSFIKLEKKIKKAPFLVKVRYTKESLALPYFFMDSNGNVCTNSPREENEIFLGSIFEDTIEKLWKKIIEIKAN